MAGRKSRASRLGRPRFGAGHCICVTWERFVQKTLARHRLGTDEVIGLRMTRLFDLSRSGAGQRCSRWAHGHHANTGSLLPGLPTAVVGIVVEYVSLVKASRVFRGAELCHQARGEFALDGRVFGLVGDVVYLVRIFL